MLALNESAPFQRGRFYDPAVEWNKPDVQYANLIGRDFLFKDVDYTLPINSQVLRSSIPVVARLCRNNSGSAVVGKRTVLIDPAVPGSVTGLAAVANIRTQYGVSDEFLPTAGVPVNSLFWVVMAGRTTVRTSSTAGDFPLAARANDYLLPGATAGFVQTFPATDQDAAGTNRDHMLLMRYTYIRTIALVAINTVNTDIAVMCDYKGQF